MVDKTSKTIVDSPLTLYQVRLFIIVGAALLAIFMFADLALLPGTLKPIYLQSRLVVQIPACMVFVGLSFLPFFPRHFHSVLALVMLTVAFSNYWVIIKCWQLEQFAFPYEGTVMYILFTLIVFRMRLRTGVYFSLVLITGFAAIALNYPIYGANTGVSIGFVTVGSVVGLLSVFQVELALKRLSEANTRLSKLSQIDPLTETFNRRTYEARFAEQLNHNRRAGVALGVFVIDLDNFKDYNDGYGHVEGDRVIKLQAEHLLDLFRRETDIVARYGGEEFIVVASHVTRQQCAEFAQQIVDQWAKQKVPHGKGSAGEFVSCSVGFCFAQVSASTEKEALVKQADIALYRAKDAGRNRFCEFQENISKPKEL